MIYMQKCNVNVTYIFSHVNTHDLESFVKSLETYEYVAILLQATRCVNTQTSENCHRQKKTYRKSAGSFSFTAV